MPYVFQGGAPLSREGKGCQKVVIPETEGIPTPESVKLHEKMTDRKGFTSTYLYVWVGALLWERHCAQYGSIHID